MQANAGLQKLLDAAYRSYQDDLENLRESAADLMERLDLKDPVAVQDAVKEYSAAASQRANDYYRAVRDLWRDAGADLPDLPAQDILDPNRALWTTQKGFSQTDYNGLTYAQAVNGTSKSGVTINDLWPELKSIDDAQQFVADMINASSRLTTVENLKKDPSRVRWARVPRGAETCAFCMMLASRGFAYLSEDTAGRAMQYHSHCDCQIIPSWGKQTLVGYDPDKYLAIYNAAKAATSGGGYRNVLKEMRRKFPGEVTDGSNGGSIPPGALYFSRYGWDGQWKPPSEEMLKYLSNFGIRKSGDRFSPEEKINALKDWTSFHFTSINNAAFGNIPMTVDIKNRIDRIDEAIADHDTFEWFTVDRRMNLKTFGISSTADSKKIIIGSKYNHAGYAACSTDKGGKANGRDKILCRIYVPTGKHAAYLEGITEFVNEREILLGRDQVFRVLDIRIENGEPVVYVEVC